MASRTFKQAAATAAVALSMALMAPGCGDDPTLTVVVPLVGTQEVPPNTSAASGQVVFTLDKSATHLTYRVTVDNIRNVVGAHFHSPGAAGANAAVVLGVFSAPANGGPVSGVLVSGTADASNLSGPLAGHPLSDLVDSMKAGTSYFNVHTGSPGTPSGPGNLPGGEIRGQVVIRPQ